MTNKQYAKCAGYGATAVTRPQFLQTFDATFLKPAFRTISQSSSTLYTVIPSQRFVQNFPFSGSIISHATTTLPPDLKKMADLGRDVIFVGMGNKVELWDAKRLAKLEEEAAAAGFEAAAGDFQF